MCQRCWGWTVRQSFWFFSKYPKGYETKKIKWWNQKKFHQSRRIWMAVRQDTGWSSSTQIKTFTDADCCPITIGRCLPTKGFKNKQKKVFKGPVSFNATKLLIWPFQGSTQHRTFKGGKNVINVRKKIELMTSNVTPLQGDAIWDFHDTLQGAPSQSGMLFLSIAQSSSRLGSGHQAAGGYVEMFPCGDDWAFQ